MKKLIDERKEIIENPSDLEKEKGINGYFKVSRLVRAFPEYTKSKVPIYLVGTEDKRFGEYCSVDYATLLTHLLNEPPVNVISVSYSRDLIEVPMWYNMEFKEGSLNYTHEGIFIGNESKIKISLKSQGFFNKLFKKHSNQRIHSFDEAIDDLVEAYGLPYERKAEWVRFLEYVDRTESGRSLTRSSLILLQQ